MRWVQHHSQAQEGREGEGNATERFHEVLSDDRKRFVLCPSFCLSLIDSERCYVLQTSSLATPAPTYRSRSYNAHTSHTPGYSHSSAYIHKKCMQDDEGRLEASGISCGEGKCKQGKKTIFLALEDWGEDKVRYEHSD